MLLAEDTDEAKLWESGKRLLVIRDKVHGRMFDCQWAADEEKEANGETELWLAYSEEAQWLNELLESAFQ